MRYTERRKWIIYRNMYLVNPVEHVHVRILPDGGMTRKDAARYLGMRPKTLAMWQLDGRGPRSVRVGGRRFYFQVELDAFIRGETAE